MAAGKTMGRDTSAGAASDACARAREICARYADAGFARAEPAILQPAELFIGLSGEDIRRRVYTVSDPTGVELCLRPDFTIPVARAYLDEAAPAEARYCYAGPAFRFRRSAAGAAGYGEFQQAGIEIFGARDSEQAEAEVLRLALETVIAQGLNRFELRLGDPGLFADLLTALDLPETMKRRLRRHFWRRDLAEDLARSVSARSGNGSREALAQALAGLDKAAAANLIEEVLALAGIVPVGGRSAEEIALRFMECSGEAAPAASDRAVGIVKRYLEIAGSPRGAMAQLAALASDEGLDLGQRIGALDHRFATIEALLGELGADVELSFQTEFGRRLEYYTGLVFEIRDPARPETGQLAGGGRYDQLLADLGAGAPIPAVGCAIYVDRLPVTGAEA
ncbi:MAG TPA: ATP phosphoribosyltransferase regulatory subunit [Hyphomicrobiales bacterium]|nr:ATP phosphoribosyltransferase regulatory subunit [Rhodobiaceae bacterium]HXK54521.1 ATP phosphoribosyltransferase regulatory subunit [Hyphomicrobiales bacterium]